MKGPARKLAAVPSVANRLLPLLDSVERHGSAWRARCPAHGSDKNRSLSVGVADDGRLLIHCFAGCTALEVVQAVGLELSDLFPERITNNSTPEQRHHLRKAAKQAQWAAALGVLDLEARIVTVAGDQIAKGEPLNAADRDRLGLAQRRIRNAWTVLHGR